MELVSGVEPGWPGLQGKQNKCLYLLGHLAGPEISFSSGKNKAEFQYLACSTFEALSCDFVILLSVN